MRHGSRIDHAISQRIQSISHFSMMTRSRAALRLLMPRRIPLHRNVAAHGTRLVGVVPHRPSENVCSVTRLPLRSARATRPSIMAVMPSRRAAIRSPMNDRRRGHTDGLINN